MAQLKQPKVKQQQQKTTTKQQQQKCSCLIKQPKTKQNITTTAKKKPSCFINLHLKNYLISKLSFVNAMKFYKIMKIFLNR